MTLNRQKLVKLPKGLFTQYFKIHADKQTYKAHIGYNIDIL